MRRECRRRERREQRVEASTLCRGLGGGRWGRVRGGGRVERGGMAFSEATGERVGVRIIGVRDKFRWS